MLDDALEHLDCSRMRNSILLTGGNESLTLSGCHKPEDIKSLGDANVEEIPKYSTDRVNGLVLEKKERKKKGPGCDLKRYPRKLVELRPLPGSLLHFSLEWMRMRSFHFTYSLTFSGRATYRILRLGL